MENGIQERIAAALKRARKVSGISQERLAELLNVSRNTIRSYETGFSVPRLETSLDWCRACGYPIEKYLADVYRLRIVTGSEDARTVISEFLSTGTTDQLNLIADLIRHLR